MKMTIPPPFYVFFIILSIAFRQTTFNDLMLLYLFSVWWLKMTYSFPYLLTINTRHCYLSIIWLYLFTNTLPLKLSSRQWRSSRGYIVPPAMMVNLLLLTIFCSYSLSKQSILIDYCLRSSHLSSKIWFSSLNRLNSTRKVRMPLILLTLILLSSFLSFNFTSLVLK